MFQTSESLKVTGVNAIR